MSQLSVTDMSVAGDNVGLVELLWRLPTELVLDFLEQAGAWELRNSLAERLAATAEMLRAPIESTPGLAERGEVIARECAEFVLSSNATLGAVAVQLERGTAGPVEVQWEGLEHLRRAREAGRPVVLFAPHVGFLYAVPLALAATGERCAVLGGEEARAVLMGVLAAVAPELTRRVSYLVVPSPGCAAAAARVLTRGEVLVMFPEVDRGTTATMRQATTEFLGRTVRLPTSAARLARIGGADIVGVVAVPDGPRRVRFEFAEPVPAPPSRDADLATSRLMFAWLERVVLRHPQLWWGWPMLDADMAITEPTAAADRA